jgi:hypothetical protein
MGRIFGQRFDRESSRRLDCTSIMGGERALVCSSRSSCSTFVRILLLRRRRTDKL